MLKVQSMILVVGKKLFQNVLTFPQDSDQKVTEFTEFKERVTSFITLVRNADHRQGNPDKISIELDWPTAPLSRDEINKRGHTHSQSVG